MYKQEDSLLRLLGGLHEPILLSCPRVHSLFYAPRAHPFLWVLTSMHTRTAEHVTIMHNAACSSSLPSTRYEG